MSIYKAYLIDGGTPAQRSSLHALLLGSDKGNMYTVFDQERGRLGLIFFEAGSYFNYNNETINSVAERIGAHEVDAAPLLNQAGEALSLPPFARFKL